MTKQSKKRSIKITFVNVHNMPDAVYLPADTDPVYVAVMRRAVKELSLWERSGCSVSERIRKGVNDLPPNLRTKLIDKKLLKGKPNEVIPTLSVWLNLCFKNGKITATDYRKVLSIVEYHGNKRIDLISVGEAEGLRLYLAECRTGGRGTLAVATINKTISIARRCFKFAVTAKHLTDNPYQDVIAGSTSNPDSYCEVSDVVWQSVVDLIPNDTQEGRELRLVMALARWGGLRIPSESRDLKFSDFHFKDNGNGSFVVPVSGKTGLRGVPVFPQLVPYYKDIRAVAPAEQVYLFERYRHCTNPGELVKKIMKRAGMKPWVKFMHNQRRTFINDLLTSGWSEHDITAVCGNTPDVREVFYYFKLSKDKLAAMGGAGESSGAHPSAPPFPPESDDAAEWRKWQETAVEKLFCRPFGLNMSAKELIDTWESSYEFKSADNELRSMLSTICDFSDGKISIAEAEKRIDDHSYRAMFFRDEYLKKGLRLAQEMGGKNSPPLGDVSP